MRNFIGIAILLILACPAFAQGQSEMNKEAYNNYQSVNSELNEVYNKILTEYKADTEFIKHLKTSQSVWEKFRDAELNMKFPARKGEKEPTICKSNYLSELTIDRIKTLKQWLDGVKTGEVCAGSIKVIK